MRSLFGSKGWEDFRPPAYPGLSKAGFFVDTILLP